MIITDNSRYVNMCVLCVYVCCVCVYIKLLYKMLCTIYGVQLQIATKLYCMPSRNEIMM